LLFQVFSKLFLYQIHNIRLKLPQTLELILIVFFRFIILFIFCIFADMNQFIHLFKAACDP